MYGAKIFACSDYKNLTHLNTTHASARVQRHRLLLEELGCTAFHIPGEANELAHVLSRLPMKELNEEQEVEELHRFRKVHSGNTKLHITLTVIE